MADDRLDQPNEAAAKAALLHDGAGEDEKRYREQHEVCCTVHHVLRQRDHRSRLGKAEKHQRGVQQRKANRHAQDDQREENDKLHAESDIFGHPWQPDPICGKGDTDEQEAKKSDQQHGPPVLHQQAFDN